MIRIFVTALLFGWPHAVIAQRVLSADVPVVETSSNDAKTSDVETNETTFERIDPSVIAEEQNQTGPTIEAKRHHVLRPPIDHTSNQPIIVKRLPWRVKQAVLDPVSGCLLVVQEQSPDLMVIRAKAIQSDEPITGIPISIIGQTHDVVACHASGGSKFVVRTAQGTLFCIDVASLHESSSIQLGDVSPANQGVLRVGPRSKLVYTTQSAGLNDPSVPISLVAIDVNSDPPRKIDVRGSRRVATASMFSIVDNETAAVALVDDDHALYFPMSIGTLGKPGEDYLRLSSNSREIQLADHADQDDIRQSTILPGARKTGLVIGRNVLSADGKKERGTLAFQPGAVFDRAPWVAGIANLSVRIASLRTATTIGTATLPIQMLNGLPHNDAIDQIGLPYAPIVATILPDMVRDRVLVIIGDHMAVVPLSMMGLPHVNVDALVVAKHYDEPVDIEQFSLSPDQSKVVTLAGAPDEAILQTLTVYDRKTSKVISTRTFARKLVSVAATNQHVYVVDIDSIPTQLTMDQLSPISELNFRCRRLETLDANHILVDEARRYRLTNEPSVRESVTNDPAKLAHMQLARADLVSEPAVNLMDRRVQNGWIVDGAFRQQDHGQIGRVGIIYRADDFVSTPIESQIFDFWNQAYADSPVRAIQARRTRETGTLLCPPVRCQVLPIQLSVVQSEIEPSSVLEASTQRAAHVVPPQVQLTLEARDLVDGRLIKQYQLLRERLYHGQVDTRMEVIDNSVFVLHRGTLIDVDISDLKNESYPRGPHVDVATAPVSLPLKRQTRVSYEISGGTPPFQCSPTALPMITTGKPMPLVPVADATDNRTLEFDFQLEDWLGQNLATIGKHFDELFQHADAYESDGDVIENLRQYMKQRSRRIQTILARQPTGIPVMIGIDVRVVDADEVASEMRHFVVIELPVKPLASQIERAKAARLAGSH